MNSFRNIAVYVLSALRALRQRPDVDTLRHAVRYCRVTLQLAARGRPDFVAEARPWICFPVQEMLDRLLTKADRVFEYGSGGSTVYFAKKAGEVVSVEHQPEWHRLVQSKLVEQGLENVRYLLVEPALDPRFDRSKIADPGAYISDDERAAGMSFEGYVKVIDQYPDGYFDLVVVDGRARPSCLRHAMCKVRVGGVLLLDQSERPYYLAQVPALLEETRWQRTTFMAPLPHSLHFTEATAFRKLRP